MQRWLPSAAYLFQLIAGGRPTSDVVSTALLVVLQWRDACSVSRLRL